MKRTSFQTRSVRVISVLRAVLLLFVTIYGTVQDDSIVTNGMFLFIGMFLFLTGIGDIGVADSNRILKICWIIISFKVFEDPYWRILASLVGAVTLVQLVPLAGRDLFPKEFYLNPVNFLGISNISRDIRFSRNSQHKVEIKMHSQFSETFNYELAAVCDRQNLPRMRRTVLGDILGYAYMECRLVSGATGMCSIRLPIGLVRRLVLSFSRYLRKPS